MNSFFQFPWDLKQMNLIWKIAWEKEGQNKLLVLISNSRPEVMMLLHPGKKRVQKKK